MEVSAEDVRQDKRNPSMDDAGVTKRPEYGNSCKLLLYHNHPGQSLGVLCVRSCLLLGSRVVRCVLYSVDTHMHTSPALIGTRYPDRPRLLYTCTIRANEKTVSSRVVRSPRFDVSSVHASIRMLYLYSEHSSQWAGTSYVTVSLSRTASRQPLSTLCTSTCQSVNQ